MAGQFDGRVALVTGAGSGIGRASALAFAREGASVVVADIAVAGGEETVRLIEQAGGRARFVRADVSKSSDVESLVAQTVDAFGRLDFGHNNAGILGSFARTGEYKEEAWDKVLAINLKGVWLCMRYEIPEMLKVGAGAIVNTASAAGMIMFPGLPAYVASKHGVIGLTKAAAIEYAKLGIRVNAVCPGFIETPLTEKFGTGTAGREHLLPMGRLGTPEEVASAVVWLCSDAASYITGHAMMIDAGMTAV